MGIIEKQSVQDIANAIRNRNGLTTLYKPREMDEAILNLYSTTKVNSMLDYILPCYEKEATSYTIQYADADRPASISELQGNTTQTGTPTPTSPVEIKTVSGDNEVVVSNEQHVTGNSYRVDLEDIELCKIGNYVDKLKRAEGKQLFDKNNMNGVNGWLNASGTMRIATGQNDRMFYINCEPNTTYTISRRIVTSSFRVATYDSEPFPTMTSTNTDYSVSGAIVKNSGTSITITTGENAKFLVVHYGHNTNDSNLQQSLDTIMINYGSTALPYEPYGNNWYIEKNIGKVVLNGTENWAINRSGTANWYYYANISSITIITDSTSSNTLCDHYTWGSVGVSNTNTGYYIVKNGGQVRIRYGTEDTVANYKTWLGNNNVTLYYPLATPSYEIITNENLIQQLNNIQNIELIENLCYVDWVGEEKPKMKLFCYLDKDKIIEEITG